MAFEESFTEKFMKTHTRFDDICKFINVGYFDADKFDNIDESK